jgi:hypothetical protein
VEEAEVAVVPAPEAVQAAEEAAALVAARARKEADADQQVRALEEVP